MSYGRPAGADTAPARTSVGHAVNLDADVLADDMLLARPSGQTLTAVIEDALRDRPARRCAFPSPDPGRLVTVDGNGLRPGVDLDDSAAMRELMDAAP